MKSRASVAGFLLLLLLLLLLVAQPDKARPAGHWDGTPPAVKTIYPTFTTIAVPGAGYTVAWGINSAGEVVGNYGQNINSGEDAHGFIYKNGKFKYFDYPGATVTVPTGINDSGTIVGYTRTGLGPIDGFLYRNGAFTTLTEGSYADTSTLGINNHDEIVGGSGPSIYATRGFRWRSGRYQTVNFPGQNVYEYLTAINDSGVAVGWDDNGAYIFQDGRFKNVNVPGATGTEALGINDVSVIVGYYGAIGTYYAFALDGGAYLSFSYPGNGTFATGINSSDQVVGEYTSDYQAYYSFVTSSLGSPRMM